MRTLAVWFVALVMSLVFASPARRLEAQPSVSALQAQVNKLATAQRKMDSTLKELELRVAKLEDDADADPKDAGEAAEKEKEEKQMAAIEQRIAALERAGSSSSGNKGGNGSARMRAPFVIEDTDGSVIFRVTGGKSPRLMIGEEKGGQVELGTGSAGGGVVRVRDASNTDRAIIIASDGTGQFRALAKGHSAVLTAEDEENGAAVSLFAGDTPSARMRSGKQGFGSIVLTNPAGEPRVFAGSLGAGEVGTVRTGPRVRPGSLGPPSILQGAK